MMDKMKKKDKTPLLIGEIGYYKNKETITTLGTKEVINNILVLKDSQERTYKEIDNIVEAIKELYLFLKVSHEDNVRLIKFVNKLEVRINKLEKKVKN